MYVRLLEGCEEKARMRPDWKPGDMLVMSEATAAKYIEAGAVRQSTEDEVADYKARRTAEVQEQDDLQRQKAQRANAALKGK